MSRSIELGRGVLALEGPDEARQAYEAAARLHPEEPPGSLDVPV